MRPEVSHFPTRGNQQKLTDTRQIGLHPEPRDVTPNQAGQFAPLDLAWSRDQAEKVYVQQRMTENAKELYAWLEDGAGFYVCGDASRMAKDVDIALHKVLEIAGGKTPDQAAEYIKTLKAEKRYQRDVY